MASFSPTDAAFEGFRITRENPAALAIWAVASLVVSFAMIAVMIVFFSQPLMELQGASEDPEAALEMAKRSLPIYLILAPLGLLVMSIWMAAVYRVVIRPQDRGFGYMKLGADELRLALLSFIYIVLTMAFFFGVVLAVAIVTAVVAKVAGVLGALLGWLAGIVIFPLFIWLIVRLSLAGPMTFAEGRLRVFASWKLTKGQFWRLLGAYVLAFVMLLIVAMFGLVIYALIALVLTGGDFAAVGRVFEPDMSSLGAYFTPTMLIYTVFASFLSAVQYAIIYAPGAVAYRELTQTGAAEVFT